MTTKKPTRTETVVEVGRRLTKRQQTRVTTEHGHVIVLDPLDPDETMNLQRIKSQAMALLQAEGIEAEPIESALGRVRAESRARDDLRDDDSLVGLAAQALRHIHQLEIIATDFGALGSLAPQHAYALGRLAVLMRERLTSTQQARDAALKHVDRGHIETDGGKTTKKALVRQAVLDAGPGAKSDHAWGQLIGNLGRLGLDPVESGAKDDRIIECDPLDEGEPLTFQFRDFKGKASAERKTLGYSSAGRGRPKKK